MVWSGYQPTSFARNSAVAGSEVTNSSAVTASVARFRDREALTAANGSSHITYQGTTHDSDSSRANTAHPAMSIQSAPRQVRRSR